VLDWPASTKIWSTGSGAGLLSLGASASASAGSGSLWLCCLGRTPLVLVLVPLVLVAELARKQQKPNLTHTTGTRSSLATILLVLLLAIQ